MQQLATLSSKYQITVPKVIREKLDLSVGDRITITFTGKQAIMDKAPDLLSLSGCLKAYAKKPVLSEAQIDKIVLESRLKEYEKKEANSR